MILLTGLADGMQDLTITAAGTDGMTLGIGTDTTIRGTIRAGTTHGTGDTTILGTAAITAHGTTIMAGMTHTTTIIITTTSLPTNRVTNRAT